MDYNERKLKIMSAGDVLDYSLELFKKNFKSIFLVVGIFNIPIFIILGFFFTDIIDGLTYSRDINTSFMLEEIEYYTDINLFITLAFFLNFFTFQLIIDFLVINIIYNDILFDKKISVFRYFIKAIINMPKLILNEVIFWITASMASLILFFALSSISSLFIALGMPAIAFPDTIGIIYLSVVVLLSIVVTNIVFSIGIYPLLRTSLGKVIVSVERKNGIVSYAKSWCFDGSRSHIYIFACGWLGLLVVVFIIIAVFLLILLLSSMFTNFVVSITGTVFAISFLIGVIAGLFIYPLFWVIYTVIYINLKVIKEGLDLELYIEKLHSKQKISNS